MASTERYYVTLVSYDRGIISVVNPDGKIGTYTQRGVHKLNEMQYRMAVGAGMLRPDARNFKDFPKEFTLNNERPDIMGRVKVTFNIEQLNKSLGK